MPSSTGFGRFNLFVAYECKLPLWGTTDNLEMKRQVVLIAVASTFCAIVGVVNSNTKKSTTVYHTHTVSVKYLFEPISSENRLLVKHNPQ